MESFSGLFVQVKDVFAFLQGKEVFRTKGLSDVCAHCTVFKYEASELPKVRVENKSPLQSPLPRNKNTRKQQIPKTKKQKSPRKLTIVDNKPQTTNRQVLSQGTNTQNKQTIHA